ncbi:hypothetical protein TU94_21855 [Streptomyces cyaneogriseus subsp. noncyanogenus]|uniref:Uncharacterized protein n=1 Tax=Streptomyces cyaneogriseus subsp. noncyanogenus TaxID=477245 RepID=A0A0C5G641_9ACTN|nr:hypothetical protein TU94_21855 [Streptomyces cyaneogriseus subsp. noncyanogenus]
MEGTCGAYPHARSSFETGHPDPFRRARSRSGRGCRAAGGGAKGGVRGADRAGRHPRAAAPGRDPQPSRHRSPEQQRPWGVRSRSAEG